MVTCSCKEVWAKWTGKSQCISPAQMEDFSFSAPAPAKKLCAMSANLAGSGPMLLQGYIQDKQNHCEYLQARFWIWPDLGSLYFHMSEMKSFDFPLLLVLRFLLGCTEQEGSQHGAEVSLVWKIRWVTVYTNKKESLSLHWLHCCFLLNTEVCEFSELEKGGKKGCTFSQMWNWAYGALYIIS